jgi:hypothetical protein
VALEACVERVKVNVAHHIPGGARLEAAVAPQAREDTA